MFTTKEGHVIVKENGQDKNKAEVESKYRILNLPRSGKAGNQLKFTINCYHTSSSMLINGGRLDLFTENILPEIQQLVRDQNDNLDNMNMRIKNTITDVPVNSQTNQDNIHVVKHNQHHDNEDTTSSNTTKCITNTNNVESENEFTCPACMQIADLNTIACEECDD